MDIATLFQHRNTGKNAILQITYKLIINFIASYDVSRKYDKKTPKNRWYYWGYSKKQPRKNSTSLRWTQGIATQQIMNNFAVFQDGPQKKIAAANLSIYINKLEHIPEN